VRGRLPAEEGALVLAALEAARDLIDAREDVPAEPPDAAAGGDVPAEPSGGLVAAGGDVSAERSDAAARDDVSAEVSAAEARADALVAVADAFVAGVRQARGGGDRYQVLVHVDQAAIGGDRGGRCELDGGVPLGSRPRAGWRATPRSCSCSNATASRWGRAARHAPSHRPCGAR
jgi:hypothetical protein